MSSTESSILLNVEVVAVAPCEVSLQKRGVSVVIHVKVQTYLIHLL